VPRIAQVAPPPRHTLSRSGGRHWVPPHATTRAASTFNVSINRALGEHGEFPQLLLGHPRRRLAGFWPEPPPAMAKGRIASLGLFSGIFVRTRGVFVKNQIFPGTPVKNHIFNSVAVLQILVKSVESIRKIRKLQT
jgi:hypothetical protein